MGMTIDKTISELEILKKNTFSYMTANQAFTTAIDTMHKYQQIEQIYQEWNEVNDFSYNQAMRKIGEVLEDGNGD